MNDVEPGALPPETSGCCLAAALGCCCWLGLILVGVAALAWYLC